MVKFGGFVAPVSVLCRNSVEMYKYSWKPANSIEDTLYVITGYETVQLKELQKGEHIVSVDKFIRSIITDETSHRRGYTNLYMNE